jgi:DNA mismatch repair ATPase MutS
LAEVYPNVQNQHLGSQILSPSSDGDASIINYTHKIMPGPCKSAGDYGVEMAATCGWPEDAVTNAKRIREEVKQMLPGEDLCYNDPSNKDFAANRRNARVILCDIAKHLAAMKEGEGRLSRDAKRNYLQVS